MGVSMTKFAAAGRSGDMSAGLRSEKCDGGVRVALTLRGEGVVVVLLELPGPVLRGEGVFRGEGVEDLPRNLAAIKSASNVSSSTSSGTDGMNRPPRTPPEITLLGVPLPKGVIGGEGVGDGLCTMFTNGIVLVVALDNVAGIEFSTSNGDLLVGIGGWVGVVSVAVPGERVEVISASGRDEAVALCPGTVSSGRVSWKTPPAVPPGLLVVARAGGWVIIIVVVVVVVVVGGSAMVTGDSATGTGMARYSMGGGGVGRCTRGGVMANMGDVGVDGTSNGSTTCFCLGSVEGNVVGTEVVIGIVESTAVTIEGDGWSGGAEVIPGSETPTGRWNIGGIFVVCVVVRAGTEVIPGKVTSTGRCNVGACCTTGTTIVAVLSCGSFDTSISCRIGAAVGMVVFRGASEGTGATAARSRGAGRLEGFFNTPL